MPANCYRLGQSVHRKLLRAQKKARGECYDCPRPVYRGTNRCFRHLLYQAAFDRARRARKAA